jgi:hypothetical protein
MTETELIPGAVRAGNSQPCPDRPAQTAGSSAALVCSGDAQVRVQVGKFLHLIAGNT